MQLSWVIEWLILVPLMVAIPNTVQLAPILLGLQLLSAVFSASDIYTIEQQQVITISKWKHLIWIIRVKKVTTQEVAFTIYHLRIMGKQSIALQVQTTTDKFTLKVDPESLATNKENLVAIGTVDEKHRFFR